MQKSNNEEFMTALQNLAISALNQIMANGVSFTIMMLVCGLLLFQNREQKQDCSTAVAQVQTEVNTLKETVHKCHEDRLQLSVKVAAMEAILDKKKNK